MTVPTRLRPHLVTIAAITALGLIALTVATYILIHQRVHLPWEDRYRISADFGNAQAVIPGQGQEVTVSGVKVGEISSVRLVDGRARVEMTIQRDDLAAVHADARLLLRPKTPLQDMSVDLDPGGPPARVLGEGDVLGVARTRPSVNLDEVLASLDVDVRDYLKILLGGGGRALEGRAAQLRRVFRASEATAARTRAVTLVIADRRRELRRTVANLRSLTEVLGPRDADLSRLVEGGDTTLAAVAAEDAALRKGLARLPAVLDSADSALRRSRPFARNLRAAATTLLPTAERLPAAVTGVRPLLRSGAPALARLTTLVRAARPLVRELRTPVRRLLAQTPPLTKVLHDARYVTNELAFNPPGPEDEGYLFFAAWFAHNFNNFLSNQDANGPYWRGALTLSCTTTELLSPTLPLLEALYATPLKQLCPKTNPEAP
ncbi:MlaD family protein [Paraconexibacter antarcticus]|uniref:MlaD family protein n=1 Tax=Paraconexibacter antarcticus TaxID=2949664 RepID=A0ABY5DW02_9ACTN|nr:MlaD family protein [Paraconexibacter antarcticus]UTI66188.1 MlaD family protein [Paraconexibacter antarcticus]